MSNMECERAESTAEFIVKLADSQLEDGEIRNAIAEQFNLDFAS